MKKLSPLIILIIFAILAGCSGSSKVHTTYDKKVDLSSYKTFDFYEIQEQHLAMKEVNRRRLAMAIELELGRKGIKRSINNPDLLVNLYSLINRSENTTVSSSAAVGYYGAATPYGAGIGVSVSPQSKYSSYYTKGVVTFDLVDRAKNTLVLEGIAKIEAGEGDDAERLINYTVQKVFADIPDAGSRR